MPVVTVRSAEAGPPLVPFRPAMDFGGKHCILGETYNDRSRPAGDHADVYTVLMSLSPRCRPYLFKIVLLLAVAAGALGCATRSPPVQEMSDARQAIHAARAAGSDLAQPQALELAEELLEQASHALAERRYSEARAAALEAKRNAIRARRLAPEPMLLE
jgi:hypothetical protein